MSWKHETRATGRAVPFGPIIPSPRAAFNRAVATGAPAYRNSGSSPAGFVVPEDPPNARRDRRSKTVRA